MGVSGELRVEVVSEVEEEEVEIEGIAEGFGGCSVADDDVFLSESGEAFGDLLLGAVEHPGEPRLGEAASVGFFVSDGGEGDGDDAFFI